MSSHKPPTSGIPPTYHPLSPITAKIAPPIVNIRLLLRLAPMNDRAVADNGTGDEIHFSSSAGIDIRLKLDLAESLLFDGRYLGVEPDATG